MSYMQNIFSQLVDERQKCCLLIIYEVSVKSILQYYSGIVFGKAVKKPRKFANTVLSFMLNWFSGGLKFLCRMLPVKDLDAMSLFKQTDIIIKSVKGYLCYKTITSQNVASEAQVKNLIVS